MSASDHLSGGQFGGTHYDVPYDPRASFTNPWNFQTVNHRMYTPAGEQRTAAVKDAVHNNIRLARDARMRGDRAKAASILNWGATGRKALTKAKSGR